MAEKPNILLVHEARGDASHWRHVIPLVHEKGFRALGAQNPLTSLSDDMPHEHADAYDSSACCFTGSHSRARRWVASLRL